MHKRFMLSTLSFMALLLAVISYWSGGSVVKAESTSFDSPLPKPTAEFYYGPYEPSIYDTVQFWDASVDPLNYGFNNMTWNFGDGATSTDFPYTMHKYAANGDYTVTHKVTTTDGRWATVSRVIKVRTRDIAITKFTRPKDGRVGQQRKFVIGISNKLTPETVHVDFYVSDPSYYDGFRLIGSTEQYVPTKGGNKTTDFLFAYTFTEADARIGKVNFKAVAYILNGRDALPADNAYITLGVNVKPATGREESAEEASEAALFIDDVANGDATAAPADVEQALNQRLYLPTILSTN